MGEDSRRYKDSDYIVERIPKRQGKISNLEERVFEQEKTTRALIEKAYELKEKLVDNVKPSSMDAALQQLWHEHIKTITNTVKRLSRDIEGVKYEISMRDSHLQTTTFQSKNIEHLAQSGVADLRGRVVRCDTSIARLAQDMRSSAANVNIENERLKQTAESNKTKANKLENEVSELTKRIDYLLSSQENRIESMQGTSSKQLETIDFRIKRMVEDLRLTIESNKRWGETERLRIEQQLMQIVELNSNISQQKQESFENKVLERIESLQRSVEECREDCKKCRQEIAENLKQNDVKNRLDQMSTHIESELARLKQEYRDGFDSVKEIVDTTNRIINAKIKLVRDDLSRDINNVKKMVVLI